LNLRTISMVAALVAALAMPLTTQALSPSVDNKCARWHSLFVPPPSVRVYVKRHGGYVVDRPFRTYVLEVAAAGAWPGTKPMESLKAGLLAIKQYAWYEVVHRPCDRLTPSGQPYDIVNGGEHQLWRPKSGLRHWNKRQAIAVDAIWRMSVRKPSHGNHWRFFRTGWTGTSGRDGWHLYEDTVTRLARDGYSFRRILKYEYGSYKLVVSKKSNPLWGVKKL
jgi:hypothetical protein